MATVTVVEGLTVIMATVGIVEVGEVTTIPQEVNTSIDHFCRLPNISYYFSCRWILISSGPRSGSHK